MATVKELLTNVANNTRKFLGTEEQLSLEEMSQGIDEASAESDFQTELIEEFSTILDRSVAPDNYVNGKEDGYAEGVKQLDALIDKSITEVSSLATGSVGQYLFKGCNALESAYFPNVTSVGVNAFELCAELKTVDFHNAKSIGENAFYGCRKLINANFPNATSIGSSAFAYCVDKLAGVYFPNVTSIQSGAFSYCNTLKTADLPKATSIGSSAFSYCYVLKSVILRSETVCRLVNTSAFNNCYRILGKKDNAYHPSGAKDGYFYVPRALLSDDDATKDYRRATNWSTFSTQFRALEDYTVDGTITGALDPNKI